jgi:hypothetical protein
MKMTTIKYLSSLITRQGEWDARGPFSWLLSVKSVPLDIAFYASLHQVLHGSPFPKELSNPRRGDIEKMNLLETKGMPRPVDPALAFGSITERRDEYLRKLIGQGRPSHATPCHHDEMAQGEEVLVIFPGLDLKKGIPSQDEKEGVFVALSEIPQRIDRKRLPRPFELYGGGRKVGVALRRQPHHFQPMATFKDMPCVLVRRRGGRNKDHFVEAAELPDLFGPPQVPEMDGIESPSK